MGLIERLKEKQGDRSQRAFAREIGISQPTISRIYSNDRQIGRRSAQTIVRKYPELTFEVAQFFFSTNIPEVS